MEAYVDGINNIVEAQQGVAKAYFEDGSIDDACPPLQALLTIMAEGSYQGKSIDDEAIRAMFTRDYLLASDWYAERLKIKQQRDVALWQSSCSYLQAKLQDTTQLPDADRQKQLEHLLVEAESMVEKTSSEVYIERLQGSPGADWIHRQA